MAYAPAGSSAGANPPMLVLGPMAFGLGSTFGSTVGSTVLGGRLWFYNSTHLQTDVGSSDFIGDGTNLGIRPYDIIIANSIGGRKVSFHSVTAVGST